MTSGVSRKVANGAIWMVLFKLVERSLGLISTLLLVRLLVPSDFGIVAMAVSVIAMVELITAFGFDVALIRDQQASRDHYDTAWTAGVLLALGVSFLLVVSAPYIAAYYREPAVESVLHVLALVPLLTSLQNVGVVAFRKELEFRKEFTYQVSRKVVQFATTISLAFWLRSYWALVIGTLAAQSFTVALSYWVHPFRPRARLRAWRSLFGFSKWLLFNNVVSYLKERSSDFVIGRVHGPASLGLYNVAYEFATLPTTELSAPINRALMPGFARLTSDRAALYAMYGATLSVLMIVAVPAAAGLFSLAPLIVPVVLGPKWVEAIPVLQILAFTGGLLMVHSSICALLIGTGHAREVTLCNALYVALLFGFLVLLAPRFGLPGAALASVFAGLASTPVYLLVMRAKLGIPLRSFAASIWRPTIASLTMMLALNMLFIESTGAETGLADAGRLLAAVGSGATIYTAALLALWAACGRPSAGERLILARVGDEFRKRVGRASASGG